MNKFSSSRQDLEPVTLFSQLRYNWENKVKLLVYIAQLGTSCARVTQKCEIMFFFLQSYLAIYRVRASRARSCQPYWLTKFYFVFIFGYIIFTKHLINKYKTLLIKNSGLIQNSFFLTYYADLFRKRDCEWNTELFIALYHMTTLKSSTVSHFWCNTVLTAQNCNIQYAFLKCSIKNT